MNSHKNIIIFLITGALVLAVCLLVFLIVTSNKTAEYLPVQSSLESTAEDVVPTKEEVLLQYKSTMEPLLVAAALSGAERESGLANIQSVVFSVRVPIEKRDAHMAVALYIEKNAASVAEDVFWQEIDVLLHRCVE